MNVDVCNIVVKFLREKKSENHRAMFSGQSHKSVVHVKIIFVSLRGETVLLISQKLQLLLSKYYFKGSFLPSLSLTCRSFMQICGRLCFVLYKKYPHPLIHFIEESR